MRLRRPGGRTIGRRTLDPSRRQVVTPTRGYHGSLGVPSPNRTPRCD
jgi:hypothetical protein